MKRMITCFAAALALTTSAAVADGLPERMASTCCAPTWSGFYVGAGVGAGAVVHETTDPYYGDKLDLGGHGILGTVTVGYDRQMDSRWVAGIFADYDFSSISTDFYGYTADHKYSWAIGARAGVLSSPTTLWYATAGYTQAKFDVDVPVSVPIFKGYFVGGGVESQLRDGWSLRGEYRFTHLESETIYGYDVEPSMHTARLVLTYKFGRRDEAVPLK